MLVIVPIFLPLTTAMGYNPIWVGVLVVAITNLGFITPPYAMGIFALKAIVKDVPIATIYTGVIPFVIDSLVVITLLVVFVPLSTWLPSLMR
jgi:C4-dicarboxylate transporter, DctM subunit